MTDGYGNVPQDLPGGEKRLQDDWLREIADDEPGVDVSAPETEEDRPAEPEAPAELPGDAGEAGGIDEIPGFTDLADLADAPGLSGIPEIADLDEPGEEAAEAQEEEPVPETVTEVEWTPILDDVSGRSETPDVSGPKAEEDPWFSQLPEEAAGSDPGYEDEMPAAVPAVAPEPDETPEEDDDWLDRLSDEAEAVPDAGPAEDTPAPETPEGFEEAEGDWLDRLSGEPEAVPDAGPAEDAPAAEAPEGSAKAEDDWFAGLPEEPEAVPDAGPAEDSAAAEAPEGPAEAEDDWLAGLPEESEEPENAADPDETGEPLPLEGAQDLIAEQEAPEAENAAQEEPSPLDGIPWLRDLTDPEDEAENALAVAGPAVPAAAAQAAPVPSRQTGVPAEEFPEIPLPPKEKRGSARNHRTLKEWIRNHKKVIKTPDYYDGAGKDERFRINYDFALAYKSPVRHLAIRRSTVRHTGWMGGLMYVVFILCISVAAASFLWLAATDVLALGKEDGIVEVTVPDDFTVEDVADLLFSQGLIRYKKLFGLYGDLSHAEDTIDPGTYQLHTNFDYRALVYGMSEDDGEMIEVSVTIPEGYTLDQIAALLEDKGVCSVEKFMAAAANTEFDYDFLEDLPTGDAYRLEGYLFPDTYNFYINDDPEDVIDKFLTDFDIRFTDEMLGRAQSMGMSIHDILTIASIIEKEAGDNSERADISSVIYNRLASDEYSLLGMDSTVYYAASRMGTEFNTWLDSPYNTYRVVGLPAGPIASPGLKSIEAALYPNETEYLFFAVDVEGRTRFFETMEEFEEFTASEEFGG